MRLVKRDARVGESGESFAAIRQKRQWRRQLLAAACAAGIGGAAQRAVAATVTWSGAAADQNWSDAGNWTGGVPAGNDVFPPQLIEHYFSSYWPLLKIDRNEFFSLGRQNPRDQNEGFCMTVLAIRLANTTNGVSKLHGQVSRKMWRNIWPDLPEAEIPIFSITNGVHTRSWLSMEMIQLYDRYLGIQWEDRPTDHTIWKRVEMIPDAELWRKRLLRSKFDSRKRRRARSAQDGGEARHSCLHLGASGSGCRGFRPNHGHSVCFI